MCRRAIHTSRGGARNDGTNLRAGFRCIGEARRDPPGSPNRKRNAVFRSNLDLVAPILPVGGVSNQPRHGVMALEAGDLSGQ